MIHPAERERVVAAVTEAAARGQKYSTPWRLNLPDSEPERWFVTRCGPIMGADGLPERYFGVNFDITEQRLVEEALRESEVRMNLAQEAAGVGAWELNLADGRSYWSESLWSLFRVPKPERGEPTLQTWGPLIHPADRERAIAAFRDAMARGESFEAQWRLNLPEGENECWFLSRGGPIAGAKGSRNRYFGVAIDITAQKRMEEALREGEERQSFLLALNDALRTVDDPFESIATASKMLGQKLNASQIVYVATDETGHPSVTHEWSDGETSDAFAVERTNELTPSLIEELNHGRTVAVCDACLDDRTRQPESVALFERGSTAAFVTVPFIKNGGLVGGLGVHKRVPHTWKTQEITLAQEVAERTWEAVERARISQALRESEDRLTFALDAADVGSWQLSLESRLYTASDQALAFFDLPPGAQPAYDDIVALMHPDDRAAVNDALQRTAETGEPLKVEFRRLLADGSIRWLYARAERRSVSGSYFIGGLIQDMTERVKQREAVERAANAKSEFLSNMSHELRTPMHAILGYSDICANAVDDGHTASLPKYLKNITTAGKRLLDLLNDLLELSKMEAGKMEYKFSRADLRDVVENALIELHPLIKSKNLDVNLRFGDHTEASFDKSYITQVIVNLLSNAIKFSEAGSKLGIDLSRQVLGNDGPGVCCRIVDEGPGIPDNELEAVFDKFVQSKKTKSGKGGTGLGLAICAHIVKAHGGAIWAENAKPRGAVFTFVIPEGLDARGNAVNAAQAAN
jgi:signal transduction histidine kinase